MDGSMLFANTAEGFKKQWDQMHAQFTQPERTMTVCEVCGVFINSTDNEQRRRVSILIHLLFLTLTSTALQTQVAEGNLEAPWDRTHARRGFLRQVRLDAHLCGLPFQHMCQVYHHSWPFICGDPFHMSCTGK